MFQQAEKRGVTVIGIKNVMSAKEIQENIWLQIVIKNLNKRVGKMKRPNLQIALDHNSLEDALADCMKVGEIVDIIEVGTILCLQEGQKQFVV